VEVLQAGLGVEALVDVGFAVEDGGAVGGERVSEGAVVVAQSDLEALQWYRLAADLANDAKEV
jgi:TPR repeat protein